MVMVLESLRVSSERKLEIVREIKEGSQPSGSFYTLLLAATLIASFGLMANSTAVVIVLSNALMEIVQARKLDSAIKQVLTVELANRYASLDSQIHKTQNNEVDILATVRAPRVIPPDEVGKIQGALFRRLKKPINLIVRTTIASDMSATGSTRQVVGRNLNGVFMNATISDEEMVLKSAEQVIREQLAYRPDYIFENVDYGRTPRGKVILAAVEGSRIPESLRGRPAECTKESAVTIVSAGHMSSFIYLYISLYLAVYSLMV